MARQSLGILISGSSHVGKTTLAARLAETLGWNVVSTDSLGRHPGRPWPDVRPPVAEYYSRLSHETIYWFLKVHHENMWPSIRRQIETERFAQSPTVFEGAALRPEYIAPLISGGLLGVCLYASDDFLRDRMHSEARYDKADETRRSLIDKFIDRSLRDNSEMYLAAQEHGLRAVDVSDELAASDLFHDFVQRSLLR